MPVRRTIPSTRHGETTERPADVPLGDGDSVRDIAHSRSGWLSSRSSMTASTRSHCRPTVPVPLRPTDRSAVANHAPASSPAAPDDSVVTSPMQADGPGSGLVLRTDRQSLLLLFTKATWSSADVPWLPSRPASRRSTLRSSGNSALEPQFPAASGGSTHDAKLHFASHSLSDSALSHLAHTVEP